mgnify:FL=1
MCGILGFFGNNNSVNLIDFIQLLEKVLGKKAKKEFLPLQPGDVQDTHADISELVEKFQYKPSTNLEEGLALFVSWFREHYKY